MNTPTAVDCGDDDELIRRAVQANEPASGLPFPPPAVTAAELRAGLTPHTTTAPGPGPHGGGPASVGPAWFRLGQGPGIWFHRLDVVGRWRAAALVVLGLLAGEIIIFAAGSVAYRVPEAGLPVLGAQTAHAVVFFAIGVYTPVLALLVRTLGRRPAGTLVSVTGRVRWRWLGWCVVAAALTLAVLDTVLFRLDGMQGRWVGWSSFLPTIAAFVVLVAWQVFGEEVMYRGLVLQAFGRLTGSPWAAIGAQAVLWMLVHWPSAVSGAVFLLLFGCMLGFLTVRTGGIEVAVACHLVMNVVVSVYQTAFWDQPGQAPVNQTAGDLSTLGMFVNLYIVLCLCGVLAALAWRRRPAHTTAAAPAVTVEAAR